MVEGAGIRTMEPKHLAAQMGLSPKRLRAMLRTEYPRVLEQKGKRWEIPVDLAKKVQESYKAKKAEAEKAKQEQIKAELKG